MPAIDSNERTMRDIASRLHICRVENNIDYLAGSACAYIQERDQRGDGSLTSGKPFRAEQTTAIPQRQP